MTLRLKVDRSTLTVMSGRWSMACFSITARRPARKRFSNTTRTRVSIRSPRSPRNWQQRVKTGAASRPDVRVAARQGITLILTAAVLPIAWGPCTGSREGMGGGARSPPQYGFLILGAILQIAGWLFRGTRMDWGLGEAAGLFMIPAFAVRCGALPRSCGGAQAPSKSELPWTVCCSALSALALCVANASINGMKSRQSRRCDCLAQAPGCGPNFLHERIGKAEAGPARQLVSLVAGVRTGQAGPLSGPPAMPAQRQRSPPRRGTRATECFVERGIPNPIRASPEAADYPEAQERVEHGRLRRREWRPESRSTGSSSSGSDGGSSSSSGSSGGGGGGGW